MVDLPQVSPELVTSKAPQSGVSPGQIASPYQMLGHALDKLGDTAEKIAEPLAEKAGYGAVTRDANGDIQIDKAPIFGPAAGAYSRAVKMGALAEAEGDVKRADIALRQQYRDNPQGYQTAADAFKQSVIDKYSKAAGPEVGFAIGRAVDSTTTMTYRGLLNEKERLDLSRANDQITYGIKSNTDDLMAMVRGGAPIDSREVSRKIDAIESLYNEKSNNPRLAFPKEQKNYEMDHLLGELGAERFLYNNDQIYKQQGPATALENAKKVLTDPSYKLTESERYHYYSKAKTEIHANEAIRKNDVSDIRLDLQELENRSAEGIQIYTEDVQRIVNAANMAGAPSLAMRAEAAFTRKPLNDHFNTLSYGDRVDTIQQLRRGSGADLSPGVNATIEKIANEQGQGKYIPLLKASAAIESSGDPQSNFDKPTKYKGLFNLDPHEFARYGGGNIYNAEDNTRAAVRKFTAEGNRFQQDFNREPTPTERYLLHQQGEAGLRSHMDNPDRPAWENMAATAEGREKGPAWAHEAIRGNLPNRLKPLADTMTSREFMGFWHSRVEGATAGGSDVSAPGGPAWLIANRTRNLDKSLQKDWEKVWTEFKDNDVYPTADKLNDMREAARAVKDDSLLETMSQQNAVMERVRDLKVQPLPMQDALVTELKRKASQGVDQIGNDAMIKSLEKNHEAIEKGLREDAPGTAAINIPGVKTPPPLNLKDDNAMVAGLQLRQHNVATAANVWQTGPYSALGKDDLTAVKSVIDNADPVAKAKVFQNLIAGLPDENIRAATLHKLGEGDPSHMASSWAGSLMAEGDVETAKSIFRGQEAIKVDKRFEKYGKEDDFASDLGKHMPPTAFSEADRTKHDGAYPTAVRAIKDVYADMSQRAGDTSGVANPDRLEAAILKVTGGIHEHNGGKFMAPVRGQSQAVTDKLIWAVDDNDMKGVTTPAGEPVGVDYLRNSAKLESFGDGTYTLRLGSDPDRPIYAYQGKDKFVLDLRHKAPGIDTKPMVSPPPGVNF